MFQKVKLWVQTINISTHKQKSNVEVQPVLDIENRDLGERVDRVGRMKFIKRKKKRKRDENQNR